MKWIQRKPASTVADVVGREIPKGPYTIKGLNQVADVLKEYIREKKDVTLVGDYDADGICASSILFLATQALGGDIHIRLPRRFSEGFGLSEKIVDEIDTGLLITVDNGIAAIEAVRKAKEKGLFVIITDHHLRDESGELPVADIIINPNAISDSATFNGYCGAGIAFKLAVAMLGSKHPLIPQLLTLAAIATIADVVPLIEENHVIARYGLARMVKDQGCTVGLKALLEVCELRDYITAKDIAFKIAPMINATGRLYDDGAIMPFNLLTCKNATVATAIAVEMNKINTRRKCTKSDEMAIIEKVIAEQQLDRDVPLCVYAPNLSEGLLGIYAAGLVEKYQVPCLVFTDANTEGIYKGSGRSCGGIHLKELLDKCADLLVKYGGHAEAAGISLKKENFDALRLRLTASIGIVPVTQNDVVYYDLDATTETIPTLVKETERFAPYGEGNPEVVFRIMDFAVDRFYLMGEGKSIKLIGTGGQIVAVGFNLAEKYANIGQPNKVNLVGTLTRHVFRGKTNIQIEIIDIKSTDDPLSDAKPIQTPISMRIAEFIK